MLRQSLTRLAENGMRGTRNAAARPIFAGRTQRCRGNPGASKLDIALLLPSQLTRKQG